jgi:hypothetical protein
MNERGSRRRPQWRGAFDVDAERALDALRLEWGEAYAVCFDDAVGDRRRWQAWRLGVVSVRLEGRTPDELAAAIRADLERGGTQ